jgi:hypothetical protein
MPFGLGSGAAELPDEKNYREEAAGLVSRSNSASVSG